MRGLFFHYKTNNLLYLLRSNVMQGYNNNKRQEYKVTRVVHCAIVCKIVLTCSVVESVQFFYFNLFVFHSFFFFFCPFLYLLFWLETFGDLYLHSECKTCLQFLPLIPVSWWIGLFCFRVGCNWNRLHSLIFKGVISVIQMWETEFSKCV